MGQSLVGQSRTVDGSADRMTGLLFRKNIRRRTNEKKKRKRKGSLRTEQNTPLAGKKENSSLGGKEAPSWWGDTRG